VFLLGSIIAALVRHGSTVPAYRFHAGIYVPALLGEALLIWLAGGFG
jgi:hypothetical protein